MGRMYSTALSLFSPLLVWYDRNPIRRLTGYFGAGIAPHAGTSRFTYTVPTGKKAWLEFTMLHVSRVTAPTTVGQAYAAIYLTPSGLATRTLIYTEHYNASVRSMDRAYGYFGIMLQEGDIVDGFTGDASTGGTLDYTMTLKMTEFSG